MSEIIERETSMRYKGAFCAGLETLPRWFAVYTTPRHEKHVSEIIG